MYGGIPLSGATLDLFPSTSLAAFPLVGDTYILHEITLLYVYK